MKERGNYFLVRSASFVRKIWPERSVIRYCLKSNPYAALFLPGKEFELQLIDSIEKPGEQCSFVAERVWSPETRHELYERGMWSLLGVNSLWEFEYLLKNVQPVVYLNGPGSDFRRTASFEPIIKTLQ